MRDYEKEILNPLLSANDCVREIIGGIIFITKTHDKNLPYIFVSGGIHGNEPAGTYLIKNLILNPTELSQKLGLSLDFLSKANWIFAPCINPTGFNLNTRKNSQNEDLNRLFSKNKNNIATKIVMDFLKAKNINYSYTIDLHETLPDEDLSEVGGEVHPDDFYIYEVCEEKPLRIGVDILESLWSRGHKTYRGGDVFGDTNNHGLISYPEANANAIYAAAASLDMFLYQNKYTPNALTVETITSYPLETRMEQMALVLQQAALKA